MVTIFLLTILSPPCMFHDMCITLLRVVFLSTYQKHSEKFFNNFPDIPNTSMLIFIFLSSMFLCQRSGLFHSVLLLVYWNCIHAVLATTFCFHLYNGLYLQGHENKIIQYTMHILFSRQNFFQQHVSLT